LWLVFGLYGVGYGLFGSRLRTERFGQGDIMDCARSHSVVPLGFGLPALQLASISKRLRRLVLAFGITVTYLVGQASRPVVAAKLLFQPPTGQEACPTRQRNTSQ
jgi:hypothetical protein